MFKSTASLSFILYLNVKFECEGKIHILELKKTDYLSSGEISKASSFDCKRRKQL